MNKKNKKLYLEVMRIFACFFVIFNHTEKYGFFLFSQREPGSVQFFLYMFLSVFCKFAVPMFFAISGALLISRENESLKDLWKKRIMKMAVTLFVFSFFYYLYEVYLGNQEFNITYFLRKLYSGNWNFSFWYLYAYLSFLISLPLIRVMAKNLEDKYFYYIFGLAIFFQGIIPCVQYYFWQGEVVLNSYLNAAWVCGNIVLYPCIGYFLECRFDLKRNRKFILPVCITDILAIMFTCYMTYYKILITGECLESQSQTFYSSFVVINCVAVFMVIKYVFTTIKLPELVEKLIFSLGSSTFGIYLLHVMIMRKWGWQYILQNFFRYQCGINHMVAELLVCFCIMISGYVLTLILKRIPLIGRLF